jgi:hypothetical protein
MSDSKDRSDGPPEQQTGNRQQLDKLIFEQNLDELYLLVDFVSGRADRSLSQLTIPSPDNSPIPMASRQIMQQIAAMRYPPNGSDAANADNAAMLLLAKDGLSALAAPARGLTIAYTAMFLDAEVKTGPTRLWDSCQRRFGGQTEAAGDRAWKDRAAQDTRVDLAVRAFPILQPHARRFRRWRDGLAMFAVFWLLLTAFAYWDAGLGRAALERLDQNWKTFTEELRDNPVLLSCDSSRPRNATASSDAKVAEEAARGELACRRHEYHRWMGETAVAEVRNVFHCEGMDGLSRLVHLWCWHWLLSGTNPAQLSNSAAGQARVTAAAAPLPEQPKDSPQAAPPRREPTPEIKKNATYWQTATSILAVFTTYILPMMFALLGTLIGAFRAILKKVRDAELGPRDFVRMMLGIPTGLVAGVAVGLFLSPSSVPVQGSGAGVGGQLTLTASGLGFLAGYASQSFFTYLDTVIGTVFPAGVPAPAAPVATHTSFVSVIGPAAGSSPNTAIPGGAAPVAISGAAPARTG